VRAAGLLLAGGATLALLAAAWIIAGQVKMPYRLLHPEALYLLALLPALWWLWLRPSRRPVILYTQFEMLRAAGAARHGWRRLALPLIRTAALSALIVAVARPQRADESSQTYVEGIAIQMVIDASSSMNDLDLSPPGQRLTRFDIVKDIFRKFVFGDGRNLAGRPNDLIGIVKFAKYADSICPLTLDHKALADVLDALKTVAPRSDDDGTAIGDGLGLAVARLVDLKRTTGSGEQFVIKSRVAILLTDGENNAGLIEPVQAGELAARHGIKVYTIMAGTGQAVMFGGRLPIADRELKQIAEVTGGRFYRADDRQSLLKIYEEIDQLERTRAEERRFVEWGERCGPWLLAALLCVAAGALLEATWLRKIP
jgi:Ca-activated chloride channel family protein